MKFLQMTRDPSPKFWAADSGGSAPPAAGPRAAGPQARRPGRITSNQSGARKTAAAETFRVRA